MCGIAGFVDFMDINKKSIDRANVLRSMLQKMNYGFGVETLHLMANAALGMQHNWERNGTPISIGPNEKHRNSELNNIVFAGTLYNEKELQTKIMASGYSLIGISICEIVLAAYQIWGVDCFEQLDGAYSVAIWDNQLQELILARDALGVQPLYYYNTGQTVCFGSTPKAILTHPSTRSEVDVEGVRDIFTFVKPPGHAVFRNMHEVLPGTAMRIQRDSTKVHKYWSLRNQEHHDDLNTTIMTIRDLLEESIARRLNSASIQLSGGLDSSTILGIASAINQREQQDNLRTFSAKWVGQYFPSGTPTDFNIEEANVIEMARREQTTHTDIYVDVAQLLDDDMRAASVNARDLPVGLGDMDMLYYFFFQGIGKHSAVALSGEGADELFGGYFWFHDPKYTHADTFSFSAVNDHWQVGDSAASVNLIDPALSKRLDLQQYQYYNYRQALSQVPKISSKDDVEQRMREVCYLHLTHWMPILLDRRDRVSRAIGIEVRLPFCDKKLIEYVFNIPWKMKKFDGNTKSLLRKLATDYIPESVAYQSKSAWVANQPPGYGRELRKKLNHVLSSGGAPVLQLLNQKFVKDLIHNPMTLSSLSAHAIGGVLRLNQWLDTYQVELVGI